ncbi:MAG TPA: TolC family protein [Acidobacteriaceae bacterium]|nr:TolC family protein [Acidobacteriaceae bacterium]
MPGKSISSFLALLLAALIATALPSARAQQSEPAGAPEALTLPQAVAMALRHSHKLALARLSVQDSQEQKRMAQAHFYPKLSNESNVLHITQLEGVVIPAGALSHGTSAGLIPAETLRIDQGADTGYTSGTGLLQPLTQLFKVHAGVRAADADLRSAQISEQDAEHGIALEVHQLYYNYLIEETRETAAQDAVQAARVSAQEAGQAVQHGQLLTNVELGSQANLLDKEQEALVTKLQLDDLTLKLDDLLGLPLGTKLALSPSDLGAPPQLPTRADAMKTVLENSPSVLEAQQSVRKAQAGVTAARDAYIPNITGIARYSYQSGLPFFTHNFGTFGASFTYDLFDGGAREAKLHDAHIKLSMAQTQLAQVENDVSIELSSAYDQEEQLQQLVNVASMALKAHQDTLRIQQQRVRVKAALPSAEAMAESDVATAQANLLNARLSLYLAQNNIARLLGMVVSN